MDRKLRIEEMQNKIDNLSLDFKVIEYNGYGKKSKFQHSCGYEFDIRIDHLLNRKVCPKCNGPVGFALTNSKFIFLPDNTFEVPYFLPAVRISTTTAPWLAV